MLKGYQSELDSRWHVSIWTLGASCCLSQPDIASVLNHEHCYMLDWSYTIFISPLECSHSVVESRD